MATMPVSTQAIVQTRLTMFPPVTPTRPSSSDVPADDVARLCGCVTQPTSPFKAMTVM